MIILLLKAEDTLVLKSLLELNASLTLVMRGVTDQAEVNMPSVTLEYLVNRFGTSRPPKLPFGLEPVEMAPLPKAYIDWAIQSVGFAPQ